MAMRGSPVACPRRGCVCRASEERDESSEPRHRACQELIRPRAARGREGIVPLECPLRGMFQRGSRFSYFDGREMDERRAPSARGGGASAKEATPASGAAGDAPPRAARPCPRPWTRRTRRMPALAARAQVLLDHRGDVARREGVEVQLAGDGHDRTARVGRRSRAQARRPRAAGRSCVVAAGASQRSTSRGVHALAPRVVLDLVAPMRPTVK